MNGGDLRFHISRKTFTEDALRFWMAELGCALRYIHSQGIVHRDVKPDNVLLDSQGHVHLADFVSAPLDPHDYGLTGHRMLHQTSGPQNCFTAGLVPSHISHQKCSMALDICPRWIGGLLELHFTNVSTTRYARIVAILIGADVLPKRPFDGRGHEALAHSVKAANPRFYVTQPPVSMPCLHAISSLLERDRRKRIGAAGWDTFTSNPFFQPIDFVALERKQIPPVFIPSTEKTNFDATYDLEELLLEEAPLEARARRQKPRAELKDDATDKEIREDELHRMIETMFEPFDYTTTSYEGYVWRSIPVQDMY
jgi:serine/threonine kinase 32